MSRHVLITGANRGIGLELVKHYLSLGERVTAVCRQSSPELDTSAAEVISGIDISSPESVASLAGSTDNIDILINNAGILRDEVLGRLNFDSIIEQFQVNTLGALRVTEVLLPRLAEGAKIGIITSRMGSIADNSSGGRYGYRMSKAALNAAAMSLSRDLKPAGIAVAVLHPGYVATEMVGGRGDISPQLAASRLAERMEQLSMDNSGTFWHSNGDILPW